MDPPRSSAGIYPSASMTAAQAHHPGNLGLAGNPGAGSDFDYKRNLRMVKMQQKMNNWYA